MPLYKVCSSIDFYSLLRQHNDCVKKWEEADKHYDRSRTVEHYDRRRKVVHAFQKDVAGIRKCCFAKSSEVSTRVMGSTSKWLV
jgi:hypothetical protein